MKQKAFLWAFSGQKLSTTWGCVPLASHGGGPYRVEAILLVDLMGASAMECWIRSLVSDFHLWVFFRMWSASGWLVFGGRVIILFYSLGGDCVLGFSLSFSFVFHPSLLISWGLGSWSLYRNIQLEAAQQLPPTITVQLLRVYSVNVLLVVTALSELAQFVQYFLQMIVDWRQTCKITFLI